MSKVALPMCSNFFSLISDVLGGVGSLHSDGKKNVCRTSIEIDGTDFEYFGHSVWVLSLSYILFVPKVGFNRRLFF